MIFAQRLKQARRKKGLSQGELGEIINAHLNSIGSWEKGPRTPDIPKLVAIAEALDTTVAYLAGETDNPARPSSGRIQPKTAKEPPKKDGQPEPVPGLKFWGAVVDAAREAANRQNLQEIADVRMMLEKALEALTAAERTISLKQDGSLPIAASA